MHIVMIHLRSPRDNFQNTYTYYTQQYKYELKLLKPLGIKPVPLHNTLMRALYLNVFLNTNPVFIIKLYLPKKGRGTPIQE